MRRLIALEDPTAETIKVPVLRVFDGDGFLTRLISTRRNAAIEVTVRFGFIDAPEIGQPGGHEAKAFLESLIGGKWVDLAVLIKMDTGGIVDRHGRIVGIPYLKAEPPAWSSLPASVGGRIESEPRLQQLSRNIELEMVLNGWAWVLERYGPDEKYLQALADAQSNKRGIWASDNNVHPWDFKRAKYRQQRMASHSAGPQESFSASNRVQPCPMNGCNGQLVERNGRFGKFVGCSNFPDCRYTRNSGG